MSLLDAVHRWRLKAALARLRARGPHPYEDILESRYRRLVRPGDGVIDVGAHTGRHLACLAELVGPQGWVMAFEPLPFAQARLRERFTAPNIELHGVALADEAGTARFIHAEGSPEESGLRERVYNRPEATRPTPIEVQVERLDRYARDRAGLAFIKIDVEGAEIACLRGARETLARHRPVVSVEYGQPAYSAYGHGKMTLFDLAAEQGYVLHDLFGHRLADRASWELACDSVYWDYLMLPREREAELVRRLGRP